MKILSRFVLAIAVVVAGAAQAAAPARWTVTTILPIAPQGGAQALAINNRGQVVGNTTVNEGFGTAMHAFLWDNGTMIDLGRAPTGSTMSSARAINDRGTVIAGDGFGVPFTWSDGTWTQIPYAVQPNVINRSGALGGAYNTGFGAHGFIYRDGVLTDVGTLGGQYSEVNGLNDKGAAVGKSLLANNFEFHPFVYEGGAMKDLGTFGGRFGVANAINSHGVVVGAAYDPSNQAFAFIYDGAGLRKLFPGFTSQSNAVGINDHGAVIGWLQGIDTSFVYDNGVLTMLDQISEVRAAGLRWLVPAGINDRGWITGYALKGTQTVSFVLMPK